MADLSGENSDSRRGHWHRRDLEQDEDQVRGRTIERLDFASGLDAFAELLAFDALRSTLHAFRLRKAAAGGLIIRVLKVRSRMTRS